MSSPLTLGGMAKLIDHSLLHPTMTDADILRGCELSRRYGVATACVKPYAIGLARSILNGSGVGVCAVIAFPHGNSCTSIKVKETEQALAEGASEIDMVINIGKAIGGDWVYVSEEIKAINEVVTGKKALLKVIFENDYLQDAHIIRLCQICSAHAVAFVKTSTGYGFVRQPNGMYSYFGATEPQLRLMRQQCPLSVQIKAAGGIRTLDDLLKVFDLGVTRVGATATETILEEAQKRGYR